MPKSHRFRQLVLPTLLLFLSIVCLWSGAPTAAAETIVTDEPSFNDAIQSDETLITVANDITLTKTYAITRDLTIRSSGGATLTWGGAANGTMFSVGSNAHFTLEHITLDGGGQYMKLVMISSATFTMNDGAVLQNLLSNGSNRAVTIGHALDTSIGGTFNMNGGLITGVSLDAAVISYDGTINMGGSASVSENSAYGFGLIRSTMNMTGNAAITNNTASRTGVGILAGEGSVINMGLREGDAPRISGNTSTLYYGGGVYLVDGELNMGFDASISDNKAETLGGGVAVLRSALTMTGNAQISGNTTQLRGGGGVFASESTVSLSDQAAVFDNSVMADDGNGGGIYLQRVPCTLTMSGASSVHGNQAAYGAGVYLNTETALEMRGGVIHANVAGTDGGGVYSHGALTIADGTIYGNRTVDGHGGGVYLAADGHALFSVSSAIANNSAPNGHGGGIYAEDTADYANLSTDIGTRFFGNRASVAYTPPENALVRYPHILFSAPSIGKHPLNNYDINFSGAEVLKFHVAYDANGGTGHYVGPDITPGYTVPLLPLEATGIARECHTFAGWNTAPDGRGKPYAPGETVVLTDDMTLFAQWIPAVPAWQWRLIILGLLLTLLLIMLVMVAMIWRCALRRRRCEKR